MSGPFARKSNVFVLAIHIHFSGKMDLNQRIPLLQLLGKGEKTNVLVAFYAMPHARLDEPVARQAHSELGLNTNGEFDEEGRAFGFVVPYPNISAVVRNDRIDNGQP